MKSSAVPTAFVVVGVFSFSSGMQGFKVLFLSNDDDDDFVVFVVDIVSFGSCRVVVAVDVVSFLVLVVLVETDEVPKKGFLLLGIAAAVGGAGVVPDVEGRKNACAVVVLRAFLSL